MICTGSRRWCWPLPGWSGPASRSRCTRWSTTGRARCCTAASSADLRPAAAVRLPRRAGRQDGGVTQSVELLLDDDLDAAVRAEWDALLAAQLPSQGRHTGETNRPHITLTIAASVPPYLETALKAELTGQLPVPVRLGGLLIFAGRGGRYVLARSVVVNSDLLELQASCAALFEGLPGTSATLRPGFWTPHVTLARNVPAAAVGTALEVLGDLLDLAGSGPAVRRWDSERRTAWRVG